MVLDLDFLNFNVQVTRFLSLCFIFSFELINPTSDEKHNCDLTSLDCRVSFYFLGDIRGDGAHNTVQGTCVLFKR